MRDSLKDFGVVMLVLALIVLVWVGVGPPQVKSGEQVSPKVPLVQTRN